VWLLTTPLIVGGCEGAHALLGRIMLVDRGRDPELFERGGYGSSLVPLLMAIVAALVLVGFATLVVRRSSAEPRRVATWVFVVLPVAGFALQEQFEYALAHGGPSPAIFASGSFLAGVAIQSPIAVLACVVARVLFRAAVLLREREVGDRTPGGRGCVPSRRWSLCGTERPWRVPVDTDPTRGPPAVALA